MMSDYLVPGEEQKPEGESAIRMIECDRWWWYRPFRRDVLIGRWSSILGTVYYSRSTPGDVSRLLHQCRAMLFVFLCHQPHLVTDNRFDSVIFLILPSFSGLKSILDLRWNDRQSGQLNSVVAIADHQGRNRPSAKTVNNAHVAQFSEERKRELWIEVPLCERERYVWYYIVDSVLSWDLDVRRISSLINQKANHSKKKEEKSFKCWFLVVRRSSSVALL